MADWPDLATVKQVLGADRSDKDNLIEAALASAIEGVVADCGGSPVEVEFGSSGEPMVTLTDPSSETALEITVTAKVARAALHRAVTVYKGPHAPFGVAGIFDSGGIYVSRYDPIYQWLLKGNRQKFSVL